MHENEALASFQLAGSDAQVTRFFPLARQKELQPVSRDRSRGLGGAVACGST